MIQSKILQKTMLLMAVLIGSYIGAILVHAFPKINTKVTALEKINVQEVLSKVVAIGKQGYAHIEEYESLSLIGYEKQLKEAVKLPLYLLNTEANTKHPEEVFKKLTTEETAQEPYFFLANAKGTLLWHSASEESGTARGRALTLALKRDTLPKEGFVQFDYQAEEAPHAHLAYLRYVPAKQLYVGAEVSIDTLALELRCRENVLLAMLDETINAPRKVNIGHSFVFDGAGEMLIAQDASLKALQLATTKLPEHNMSLYDAFTQATQEDGVLHYMWPDEQGALQEKIVWIEYVPELDWFVGTTLYADELEVMSNKLQRIIATLGIVVFLVALIISFVFFKKLLLPISTLSQMANSATNGDYSVRSSIRSNDEIGELSKNFNTMIQTIEKNIEKEKQIMEQSRLAQMGEMMSMIAHQWRQPLGAIGSAVMNMKMKLQSQREKLEDPKAREMLILALEKKLSSIEEYVQFLSTTVDDFRTFFKKNAHKEYVPISEPVEKALHMIEASMASKNITISKTYLTNDALHVYVNELVQVLLNILKNSEDNFVEKQTPNPRVTIITQKEAGAYRIVIVDNGGGVPEYMLSKLCEPYFSTKHEKNGTGLGLYMSRVIVEDHHGGALNVSNVENGISFEIVLPR